jgi:UDP-glucose 4-epimerase
VVVSSASGKSNSLQGKNVLITGGLGFLGSNLAIRLVNSFNANVTVLTKTTSKVNNIFEIREKVRLVQGDITDYDLITRLVSSQQFVFHLAAQTSNIESMMNPLVDLGTNLGGTLGVLEACRRHNPNVYLVSVGTVTQVGRPETLPVSEEHRMNPITVYDANKMLAEHYFRIYFEKFGIRTSFLRLPTLYGERQDVRGGRTGIVNSFIWKAINGDTIQVYGSGDFMRDFLYVGDVVEALICTAITNEAIGKSFQIASGKPVEFIEMVKAVVSQVSRLTGTETHIQHVPWPAEWKMVDIGSFVGDYTRFKQCTGWLPRTSLQEGIALTARYLIDHKNEYQNG